MRSRARTRFCPFSRCPAASRSARWPSASRVQSMRPCSRPPCWHCPTPRSLNASMHGAPSRPPRLASGRRTELLLKSGATIGILGGGQLARMLALAAAPLGLRCHVYSPDKNSCAFDVVHAGTVAAYEDEKALARFADAVDVITYEFENVPAKTAAFLAKRKPVLPNPQVLEITQDRLIEKNFISE